MSNADTVRAIYESFGRGDVQGILDCMHPDVEWERWDEGNSLQDAGYPPLQQRKGHNGVLAFLGAVQETIELLVFELRGRCSRTATRLPHGCGSACGSESPAATSTTTSGTSGRSTAKAVC
jgi:hypothetical protein